MFPRFLAQELRPLVRMLEDPFFSASSSPLARTTATRMFQPSFDVHETKDSYVLDGELPGIQDKSNLDIEFTDHNTLVVKGRVERSSTDSYPPAAESTTSTSEETNTSATPKSAVEDEATSSSTNAVVTKAQDNNDVATAPKKYWVRERSVGEFQRSFSFPQAVEQDAVKASLKNGILSIVVPKRAQAIARKISVE